MTPRFVEQEAFSVVGLKTRVSTACDGANAAIPQLWQDLSMDTFGRLAALSDLEPAGVLGVAAPVDAGSLDYWIAAATTKAGPPEFASLAVPASTWAVFTCTGPMPDAIQQGFADVYGLWLPGSDYEHADAPDLEWYAQGDTSAADYQSEIWIPVVKK